MPVPLGLHPASRRSLWDRGGELHRNLWPECCGFVILPESQNQLLTIRHGSFGIRSATISCTCSFTFTFT